ncbi:armadillo-type protein [Delphinella strobiligena]|nr:armadillo-type protein [Delphinella strobiligena]
MVGPSPMDALLARLSEQQGRLAKQKDELTAQNKTSYHSGFSSCSTLDLPNTDPYATTPRTASNNNSDSPPDPAEVLRLKQELVTAQTTIAHMDQELSQSRITKHTMEQALGSQFDPDYDHTRDLGPQAVVNRVDNWVQQTDPVLSVLPSNKYEAPPARGIWNAGFAPPAPGGISGGVPMPSSNGWSLPGPNPSPADISMRSSGQSSRPQSAFGNHLHPWNSFNGGNPSDQTGITPPMTPLSFQGMHGPMDGMQPMQPMQPSYPMQHQQHMPPSMSQPGVQPYIQRPIGTRLSPMAAEFHGPPGTFGRPQPWHMQDQAPASYMSTAEPMNYRRLLDRNMSCNWKYIVDKIVHSNDQQASIFLQQKLKVGTTEQKYEIVQAIIDQAYPLMVNRFGNFLVQRCFEHGTPEQVIAIARAIRGNTLNLSMDAFGCHVVQKAFDCVPEEYKAIMVHELLRRIPETVIHRYACHVWQKLFELRWSDSPPQIMKYVNEALRGMWHEVALGETGSLVVQNIFENCLEEDKRPCINEVLASIDVVAHGQFGNWCIQHICEHGNPPDRTRAIDHVLRFATEYSMDQFASKVVEKCLKISSTDFLDRYLDRVCEARPDRPRMPLIDISGDQFGNYLIQYILTHADPQRREIVAAHIRKHMVSLRGSKYGSRVAMLCCNPAVATRPGPPVGLPMSNRGGYREGAYGGNRGYGAYSGGSYR